MSEETRDYFGSGPLRGAMTEEEISRSFREQYSKQSAECIIRYSIEKLVRSSHNDAMLGMICAQLEHTTERVKRNASDISRLVGFCWLRFWLIGVE